MPSRGLHVGLYIYTIGRKSAYSENLQHFDKTIDSVGRMGINHQYLAGILSKQTVNFQKIELKIIWNLFGETTYMIV
jgi:hypothetical protein